MGCGSDESSSWANKGPGVERQVSPGVCPGQHAKKQRKETPETLNGCLFLFVIEGWPEVETTCVSTWAALRKQVPKPPAGATKDEVRGLGKCLHLLHKFL